MHRRHKRHKHNDQDYGYEFKQEFDKQRNRQKRKAKEGYGINLYRNKKDKMIAGVCAGIGDHFGIDYTVMRVLTVVAFFMFGGFPLIVAYILACFLIASRPKDSDEIYDVQVEYDEKIRDYRPKTVFSKKEGSKVRIERTKMRLRKAKKRIEEMERYVISNKFKMEQEFSDLQK